jgi:hypothetical protein
VIALVSFFGESVALIPLSAVMAWLLVVSILLLRRRPVAEGDDRAAIATR